MFMNTVINFLIVALAVFLLLRQVNRLFPKPDPAPAPAMKRLQVLLLVDSGAGDALPPLHVGPEDGVA